MTGMVAQICPKAYSGSRATKQKASIAPVAQDGAVAAEGAATDAGPGGRGPGLPQARRARSSRKPAQTIPEAKKLSRYEGSTASRARAMSGPMEMPAFSATRETLNASVRCSRVVTSAIIALLAVMNCAQPKAASKAMSATITARSRVRPRPM